MFLGLDESNKGLFPEIYVACTSHNKNHTLEGKTFPKKRKKEEEKRIKTFIGLPYKHILFTKDFENLLNRENYKTVAIGEFSKFYSFNNNIKKIFMDGELNNNQVEKILEMLHRINKKIKFQYGKCLDQKIRIVNEADNRANFLFRYYRDSPEKNKTKYIDTLLIPDLKGYEKFLI
ncbi:MAG: hypothetical protein NUV46_02290 [Nanoarchaeota archaeon]|nr:hypothetical protein [Nanoarchaeota archaeon]